MQNPFAGIEPGTVVLVRWLDAQGMATGWLTPAELHERLKQPDAQAPIDSVGFFLSTTDDYAYLAGDLSPLDGAVNQVNALPLGMIQSVKPLYVEATA